MLTKQETWVQAIPLGYIWGESKLRNVSGSCPPSTFFGPVPFCTLGLSIHLLQQPQIREIQALPCKTTLNTSGRIWQSQTFPTDGVRDHLSEWNVTQVYGTRPDVFKVVANSSLKPPYHLQKSRVLRRGPAASGEEKYPPSRRMREATG